MHIRETASENDITFWKKLLSYLRVNLFNSDVTQLRCISSGVTSVFPMIKPGFTITHKMNANDTQIGQMTPQKYNLVIFFLSLFMFMKF